MDTNSHESFSLPEFPDTDAAVDFGRTMSRAQTVLLSGARQALQREVRSGWTVSIKRSAAKGQPNRTVLQICCDVATTIGKLREAIETRGKNVLIPEDVAP